MYVCMYTCVPTCRRGSVRFATRTTNPIPSAARQGHTAGMGPGTTGSASQPPCTGPGQGRRPPLGERERHHPPPTPSTARGGGSAPILRQGRGASGRLQWRPPLVRGGSPGTCPRRTPPGCAKGPPPRQESCCGAGPAYHACRAKPSRAVPWGGTDAPRPALRAAGAPRPGLAARAGGGAAPGAGEEGGGRGLGVGRSRLRMRLVRGGVVGSARMRVREGVLLWILVACKCWSGIWARDLQQAASRGSPALPLPLPEGAPLLPLWGGCICAGRRCMCLWGSAFPLLHPPAGSSWPLPSQGAAHCTAEVLRRCLHLPLVLPYFLTYSVCLPPPTFKITPLHTPHGGGEVY